MYGFDTSSRHAISVEFSLNEACRLSEKARKLALLDDYEVVIPHNIPRISCGSAKPGKSKKIIQLADVFPMDLTQDDNLHEPWMPGTDYCLEKYQFTVHIHLVSTTSLQRDCAELIEKLTTSPLKPDRIAPVPSTDSPPFSISESVIKRVIYVPTQLQALFDSLSLSQVRNLWTNFFFRASDPFGGQDYNFYKPKWFDEKTYFVSGKDSLELVRQGTKKMPALAQIRSSGAKKFIGDILGTWLMREKITASVLTRLLNNLGLVVDIPHVEDFTSDDHASITKRGLETLLPFNYPAQYIITAYLKIVAGERYKAMPVDF